MKIQNIIQQLNEQKSFKYHIPKRLDYQLQTTLQQMNMNLSVNDVIDLIEGEFKKTRYNSILINYTQWFLENLLITSHDRNLLSKEVIKDITTTLVMYHQYKQKGLVQPEHENIWNIRDIRVLEDVIKNVTHPTFDKYFYKSGEAHLIYDRNGLRLIKINSFAAAVQFGSGGRGRSRPWCILHRGYWDLYKKQKSEWVFLLTNKQEKYAIDTNSGLVWDNNEDEISVKEVYDKYPVITSYLLKLGSPSIDSFDPRKISKLLSAEVMRVVQRYFGPYPRSDQFYSVEVFRSSVVFTFHEKHNERLRKSTNLFIEHFKSIGNRFGLGVSIEFYSKGPMSISFEVER